jgi:flagellin
VNSDAVATVTVKIGEETLKFQSAGFTGAATPANIVAALKNAVAVDDDGNAIKDDDGLTTRLSDYFTVTTAQSGGKDDLVFTEVKPGKEGSGATITGVTVKAETATAGTTSATAGTDAVIASTADSKKLDKVGTDAYWMGTLDSTINSGTQVIEMNAAANTDQLANTVLDLKDNLTDGTKIRLGDTSYIIAVGEDSAYKTAENAVYVADLSDDKDKALAQITSQLTKVAANNETFTVGQGATAGSITLQQKKGVKDSTDMTTMQNLVNYIGVSHYDKAATDKAIADAKQAVADEVAANADKAPLTLQIGDTSDSYNQMEVKINDMHANAIGSTDADGNLTSIADISISTAEDAQAAVSVIKDAINSVSSTRGDLGAIQNRLEHTSNNLSVMSENIQDAESTIRDTDIAEEMMSYTKNNILVQSAQAMLAQANQVPQGVLQLLQ